MGERTVMQEALFYSFSLEDHVPADHLLRSVDRFVDLGGLREHLRPYYSETGRPSIDPELMIRMLVVGYCMGTRQSRQGGDDRAPRFRAAATVLLRRQAIVIGPTPPGTGVTAFACSSSCVAQSPTIFVEPS